MSPTVLLLMTLTPWTVVHFTAADAGVHSSDNDDGNPTSSAVGLSTSIPRSEESKVMAPACNENVTFDGGGMSVDDSTVSTSNAAKAQPQPFWENTISSIWFRVTPPVLLAMTTIGNSLSNPLFRKSSTSFILSAMAVADAGVIYVGLLRLWIGFTFRVDIRLLSAAGCKIHMLLTYFFRQVSSWTLVLLTIERLISVWLPFRCKELCSRRRMTIAFVATAVMFFGVNIHFLFTFHLFVYSPEDDDEKRWCYLKNEFRDFFYGPWYLLDLFLGTVLPFVLICTGNCVIVAKIVAAHRRRTGQLHAADDTGKVASTTLMLFVASCAFLFLSIPLDVYFIGYSYGWFPAEDAAARQQFYTAVTLLYYTNNSINFFLYFASGSKFRHAFLSTFSVPCHCRTGSASDSVGRAPMEQLSTSQSNSDVDTANSVQRW